MQTAAQGSLGDNLKLDWMRTPHATVAVPVTAAAANRARSSTGARFHIDRSQSISVTQLLWRKIAIEAFIVRPVLRAPDVK
jgi:hypothetical protein